MAKKNRSVDEYINNQSQWKKELTYLRKILLKTALQEDYKWQQACYTYEEKNIVLLTALKARCVLGFFKGALLKDPKKSLSAPGPNTQSARQMNFKSLEEIIEKESEIINFIQSAIEIEKSGKKIVKKEQKLELPVELASKFEKSKKFSKAFDGLSPGRQRAYIMFFSAAKSPEARIRRIEKYTSQILDGKGIHDCTCGFSKKLPSCDGSHNKLLKK